MDNTRGVPERKRRMIMNNATLRPIDAAKSLSWQVRLSLSLLACFGQLRL